MKKITAFLLLATIWITGNSFAKAPGKEKIEIIFTNSLTFADLATIRQNLQEKGIFMEYRRLEFDKKKNLKKIEFFVDCKDGYSGTASASKLSKEKKFGFYRDFNENSKMPFAAGFF